MSSLDISDIEMMFDVDPCDMLIQNSPPNLNGFCGGMIPSDDIWKKFDFEYEITDDDDGVFTPSSCVSTSSLDLLWAPKEHIKEIRHHDCMWAGLCGSKDHKNAVNCILAYEDLKPAPLNIKVEPGSSASSSPTHNCNYNVTNKNNNSSSCNNNENINNENTISRTTLNNGTQITTVFKNRTNLNCNNNSNNVSIKSEEIVSNIVKVSIVDRKSKVNSNTTVTTIKDNNLTYLKHLSTSNESLMNDDIHLMPISEVTGQQTRMLSIFESNPPIVDAHCANQDHNYGMAPLVNTTTSQSSFDAFIKSEKILDDFDIKKELLTSDTDSDNDMDDDYPMTSTASAAYMSPTSSICSSNGSKFDYGVQQVISSKYIKTEDLGVQTPSDSDEEVDVVSLYDIDWNEKCKKTLITPPQSVLTSRSTTPNCHSQQNSVSKQLLSQQYSSSSKNNAAKRLIKSTLPTNPFDNLDTYEELQRNVAKVIKKSTNSKTKRGRKPAKKKSKKNSTTYLNKQSKNSYNKSNGYSTTSKKQRDYDEYKKQYLAECKTKTSSYSPSSTTDISKTKSKKQYRIDLLPEKRKFHNNMERKRRVDLRNLFEELRELIPNLHSKKRAPKVQILNEAESLCNELSYKSKMQSKQAEELRREQNRLRAAVAPLRYLFYEKNMSYMK